MQQQEQEKLHHYKWYYDEELIEWGTALYPNIPAKLSRLDLEGYNMAFSPTIHEPNKDKDLPCSREQALANAGLTENGDILLLLPPTIVN